MPRLLLPQDERKLICTVIEFYDFLNANTPHALVTDWRENIPIYRASISRRPINLQTTLETRASFLWFCIAQSISHFLPIAFARLQSNLYDEFLQYGIVFCIKTFYSHRALFSYISQFFI